MTALNHEWEPYRVLMVRADGTATADLDNVSIEWADRHAAYLRAHLHGNPGIVRIDVVIPKERLA